MGSDPADTGLDASPVGVSEAAVGDTSIPVVCSWAFACDDIPAKRRQTASFCLLRPAAIAICRLLGKLPVIEYKVKALE